MTFTHEVLSFETVMVNTRATYEFKLKRLIHNLEFRISAKNSNFII